LRVHPPQLLANASVFRHDEIKIGRERFQGAKGLPHLMSKISEYIYGIHLSHSGASSRT
jgi:hypothetical protein